VQIDALALAPGSTVDTDVCIVGAGAAGLTLARALLGSGLRVLVVESGGFDFDAGITALGDGDNLGAVYYPLADSRLRFFGGTTSIWGGRCAPLDPVDFEPRKGLPLHGWPIRYQDLLPGYETAQALLEAGPFRYDASLWSEMGLPDGVVRSDGKPGFAPDLIDYSFWRFDFEKARFGVRKAQDLLQANDVTVLLRANVVALEANADACMIRGLDVRAPDDRRIHVKAARVVLAAGGIENPRILLASRGVEPEGIGNRHDQVGRCFMEHPHGRLGRIEGPNGYHLWDAFRMRFREHDVPIAPVLRLAAAAQHARGLLNTAVTFKLQKDPRSGIPRSKALYQSLKHQLNPTRNNRTLWHWYRDTRLAYRRWLRPRMERIKARRTDRVLSVMIRGEQAPNPMSRVLLSDRTDRHGVPLANLDWRMSAIDKATVRGLGEILDAELQRLRLGRLIMEDWVLDGGVDWPADATVGNHPFGGYHHMGTTRMSSNPAQGVVDTDCRVHGYHNLYVAGSSVFPTGGWANPTLTIMALAMRLAGHLRGAMRAA
jgi:choline dehydrogenase-like flavoprotein